MWLSTLSRYWSIACESKVCKIRVSRFTNPSTYQVRFVIRRLTLLVHLEDGQYENLWIRLVEGWLIPPSDHLEELRRQIWVRIQLDIACKHVERRRRFTGYVTPDVHRVQQLLLVFIHL